MPALQDPVLYHSELEQIQEGESAAIEELKEVFVRMASTVAEHEGQAHRAVHAKGQALLRAAFKVHADLPPELAQGLFSSPGRYQALIRFSSPPAEQLPDSVSTPRAVAIKIIGVEGERLPDSFPGKTQDFLLVNGPTFTAPTPAKFLGPAKLLASTTEKMPRTKTVISATLRGAEAALDALGAPSDKLKALGGEPQRHPLGETYFTQVPFLYGRYIAKFSLAPSDNALLALEGAPISSSPDTQREAIDQLTSALDHDLTWEFRVQLCRNLSDMPLEDASVPWSEEESPWLTVATVYVPPQRGWSDAAAQQEVGLAFAPWNCLAAHRPLGGVNRARREVMAASREFRSAFNRCPITEPHGFDPTARGVDGDDIDLSAETPQRD
ncbi:hypothetical protein SAMN05428982_0322 [Pseudoxanthomonas sp. CF385]|nr:hypothetical protein SAMN05428982_0322 [Pseudoxanthomonas sp. CF385]